MFPISIGAMIDDVARQELLVGAFLTIAGLAFIILGLRLSRMLLALSYGVIGFVLGACIPGPNEVRIGLGLAVALTLGGASLWLMRPAIAVLAGLWAALAASSVLPAMGYDGTTCLVACGVAFAVAVSLSVVSGEQVIALVTSLEGTLLFLGGLIVLCGQNATMWSHLRSLLVGSTVFVPFLLLSGTVAGFYTQMAELQKKQMGQSA